MKNSLDIEIEKAIRFLVEHLPKSKEDARKPVLFHDIRVGMNLHEKGYSREVILAGFLHDTLEWSKATEELLSREFGDKVLFLVKANTKDRSIADSDERIKELIGRAAQAGKDALIIKAVDTLDSFKHYTKPQNRSELEYCRKNAEEILKYKKEDWNDMVFGELKKFIN